MPISTADGIITPAQFEQYFATWLTIASASDTTALKACFERDAARLLLVRYPLKRVLSLLSTPGIAQIKARFLVIPGEGAAPSRFSIALYATNLSDERVSAYYVAEGDTTSAPLPPSLDGGVPNELAQRWTDNWQSVAELTAAMFTLDSATLQGYNFPVKDFVQPLFSNQPFADQEYHLSFGLYEYFSPLSSDAEAQTFGLLLRLYTPQQGGGIGFFDMSTPCPPGH